MKRTFIAAAAIILFASSAHATNLFGNTTNNNQTYNQPQSHATANGGTGLGVGVGVGIAAGGSATGGSVGDIRNTNTNTALGGAGGSVIGSGNSSNVNANLQGQSQSTSNSNNASQSVTVNGDTFEAQARNPVSTAYAPTIMPTAPCMGSTSGGAQGVGFGFSIGGTWIDENCQLLEQARAVSNLGERAVAIEMLNSIPAVSAARKRLADKKSGSTPAAVVIDEPRAASRSGYAGNDPIVRARLGLPPLK